MRGDSESDIRKNEERTQVGVVTLRSGMLAHGPGALIFLLAGTPLAQKLTAI
jgi:hypothetical protein